MAYGEAISNGGISTQPWMSPKSGGGVGTGLPSTPAPFIHPQGIGSTGMGGNFGEFPGQMEPAWQNFGFFGGRGNRGMVR